MNDNSINFLSGGERKKEPKKEKEEIKEVTFVITPEKEAEKTQEVSSKVSPKEKKEKKSLFSFLKNIFQKKKKTFPKEEIDKEKEIKTQKETLASPEISFIPEKIIITPKVVKEKKIQLAIFIFLALIIVFSLYLFANFLIEKKTKEIRLLKEELKSIKEENANFYNLLKDISHLERNVSYAEKLFKKHPHFTNLLSFLEKYTLPEVYYQDLSVDLSGKITLPAVAKNLSSMVKQLVVFQSIDEVEEVKFSGFNFLEEREGERPVSFQIQLILKDKIFYSSP